MRSPSGHVRGAGKGYRPWGILVPFIGLAFVAGTVVSLTALFQHMGLVDAEENPVGLRGFITFLVFPFAALGTLVIAWVRLVERRTLASIGLGGPHRRRLFVRGLLTGVSMVIMIVTGIFLIHGCRIVEFARPLHSFITLGGIAALLASFVVQSSAEELLFRGWMLSAIASRLRVGWGVVLSSLAFTLMHFDPRGNALFKANVFLFAVFACCWVIRTGNIWSVIGWHSGWNWLLAVGFQWRVTALDAHVPALLAKVVPVGSSVLNGGIEGPEGSIVCTVVLTSAIGYQLFRQRSSRRKPKTAADIQLQDATNR